ncbi:MAG: hypothetical protein OEW48_19760 [Phycisphaerae bacterium]|nr:hypothetical protein [Phycisphaerae bacterium]
MVLERSAGYPTKFNILGLINYRYNILGILLLVLFISHAINGQWVGDFWEHSAVVRELSTAPLNPKHSQLLLDVPQPLYSPYSLGVALISRIMGIDAITALSIAGIINLLFFLISLKLFVSSLFPKYAEATSFYTLVFTLLLWGQEINPWDWSGFFHLKVLGYVLPYPSTFTISLVFTEFYVYIALIKSRNHLWYFPVFGLATVILISHPFSFIPLCIGLAAITLGFGRFPLREFAALLLLLFAVLIFAALWPYYPLIQLFLKESYAYNATHIAMYQHVVKRILPSLIGIPSLLFDN